MLLAYSLKDLNSRPTRDYFSHAKLPNITRKKSPRALQNEDKRHFWRLSFSLFKNSLSHHLLIYTKI